jgi:ABC-2 type transport system permease protein
MLIILGGIFIGLLRNPEYGGVLAFPRLIAGVLIFVAFNLLLAAGSRNLLERWLLRTRMREVAVLILVLVGVLPQVLQASRVSRAAVERFVPTAVYWPWAAASRFLLAQSIWLSTLALAIYMVIAYWFSRRQFEIGLRYDAASKMRKPAYASEAGTEKTSIIESLFRLPGRFLPDPLGAIVEKEIRSLLRTPRFRLVFLMACIFGLMLYMPALLRGKSRPHSFMTDHLVTIACVYGLLMIGQVTYWNAFGFDRSAAQAYFSFPVSLSNTLAGKNLAVMIFVGAQVLAVIALSVAVRAPVGPVAIAEAVVVTSVAALYWLALGNLSSVHVPRGMDPEKINSMANKMQAVVIWLSPLVLLPIGLAYWARYVFQSDMVFFGLMALAGVLGAVLYWIALDSAVTTAYKRREKIVAALTTRDGPLSIT